MAPPTAPRPAPADRRTPPRARAARWSPGWTLAAATTGFALVQVDIFAVNVGVRQIGLALGGGIGGLQWIVSAYTLAFAGLILTGGALGDRRGPRRIFALGFVVFAAGSAACAFAPDLVVLIAGRAVQGSGGALLGACSLALVNHAYPDPSARARALGVWAAGTAAALSAGPVIGGALVTLVGWRAIFFVNLPVCAAGLVVTLRCVAEAPAATRHIDVPGQLSAVVAMGALVAGLIRGGSAGFASPFVVGALVLAGVAGVAFVRIESRVPEPMLRLSLFGDRGFTGPVGLGLVVNLVFFGLVFLFSLFFQKVQGHSALHAGLAFLPMTLAALGADLAASRVATALGYRWTVLLGLGALGAGAAGVLAVGAATPFAAVVTQQVLLGLGIGLIVPPMTGRVLASVAPAEAGVAAGTLTAARQTGSVLGIAVFGALVASGGFVRGLHAAAVVSVAAAATAALLVWWTTGRHATSRRTAVARSARP